MKLIVLLNIFIFLLAPLAYGKEIHYLMRSPRALLMGDAYTTLAKHDYSLFYNPATLGRHKGFSLFPFDATVTLFNPLEDLDTLTNLPSTTSGLVGAITGLPIHVGTGITPTIKLGGFGLTLWSSSVTNMTLLNNVQPIMDMYHTEDNGFIFGYGWQSGKINLGVAMKYIKRRGFDANRSVLGSSMITAINNGISDPSDLFDVFGMDEGKSWGYDIGMEYVNNTGPSEFIVGLSVLDVNDTEFTIGSAATNVPSQKMSVNLGMSLSMDYTVFDWTISADLHPLNQKVENNRRLHLGFDVGLPLLRLIGGYNAGYFSYGTQINLGIIDIYAGFYDVEVGSGYKEEKASRVVF
jgi:hypothetical protein